MGITPLKYDHNPLYPVNGGFKTPVSMKGVLDKVNEVIEKVNTLL